MRSLLITFILFSCVAAKKNAADDAFRMPGEWEEHEAVWVGIHRPNSNDSTSAAIIKALHREVTVRINYTDAGTRYKFNRFLQTLDVDTSRLEWIPEEVHNCWMRDPGPLFLVNKKGEQKIIDFNWNEYGRGLVLHYKLKQYDIAVGETDQRMAMKLKIPIVQSSFVAEGGGLETNGAGVLLSIRETALQRNPGKTIEEIEKEYLRVTHCKKMIWLNRMTLHDKVSDGLSIANWMGGGANGHIDEVARFVAPGTIALAKIDETERQNNPMSAADFEILEEYYETLRQSTDVNGQPFTIIRFPYPDLKVHAQSYVMTDAIRGSFARKPGHIANGDTIYFAPAVSYLNFMVTNNVVLSAAYWKPGMPLREKEKDEEVKYKLGQLYPGRKIIQINPSSINRSGGGIHCVTQQQPRGNKN
jgi:agmatine deiminase